MASEELDMGEVLQALNEFHKTAMSVLGNRTKKYQKTRDLLRCVYTTSEGSALSRMAAFADVLLDVMLEGAKQMMDEKEIQETTNGKR